MASFEQIKVTAPPSSMMYSRRRIGSLSP